MRTSGVAGAVSAIGGSVSGSTCVAKRLLQQIESAVELLVGDRERHEDADHVAVDPAGEENETPLASGGGDTGSGVRRLLRELEREHRPEPAHLVQQVALSHKVLEARPDPFTEVFGALAEAVGANLVQDR